MMHSTQLDDSLRGAYAGSRVLVTGAAGFIAGHVIEALLALGADVTASDARAPEQPLPGLPPVQRAVVGEVGFRELFRHAGPFDYIFHLGARAYAAGSVAAPVVDFHDNLAATLDLLELLRHERERPRLVFASSAAVYGNPSRLPICEDDVTVPVSPYGVSKLAAERYVAVYASLYGIPAVSLRLFSVYGPRQTKQVVYDLLCKLRDNPDELLVIGDGQQVRDLVYVGDVVHALLTAGALSPCDGAAYNVASGAGTSMGELAHLIIAAQGSGARVRFTGQNRPGDPDVWLGSSRRLEALGWRARHTMAEGLAATAAWFNEHAMQEREVAR